MKEQAKEKLQLKIEALTQKCIDNPILKSTVNGGFMSIPPLDKLVENSALLGFDVSNEQFKEAVDVLNQLKSSYWMQGGSVNSVRVSAKGKGCVRTQGTRIDQFLHSLFLKTVNQLVSNKQGGECDSLTGPARVMKKVEAGISDKGGKEWGLGMDYSYALMSAFLGHKDIGILPDSRDFEGVKTTFLRIMGISQEVEEFEMTEEEEVERAHKAA